MWNLIETVDLPLLALAAGIGHLGLIPAMVLGPRIMKLDSDLGNLSALSRKFFGVLSAGMIITILGMGMVVILASDELASGTRLASCLTGFLGVFWTFRFAAQAFLFGKLRQPGYAAAASHYGLAALLGGLLVAYWILFAHNVATGS